MRYESQRRWPCRRKRPPRRHVRRRHRGIWCPAQRSAHTQMTMSVMTVAQALFTTCAHSVLTAPTADKAHQQLLDDVAGRRKCSSCCAGTRRARMARASPASRPSPALSRRWHAQTARFSASALRTSSPNQRLVELYTLRNVMGGRIPRRNLGPGSRPKLIICFIRPAQCLGG